MRKLNLLAAGAMLAALLAPAVMKGADEDPQVIVFICESDGAILHGVSADIQNRWYMEKKGDYYEADSIPVEYGVVFYTTDGKFYCSDTAIVPEAVMEHPVPADTTNLNNWHYVPLPKGTYNAKFYLDGYEGNPGQFMELTRQEGDTYPEHLYLVSEDGSHVTLSGTDGTYLYHGDLPSEFRISYSLVDDKAIYNYGPTSGSDIALAKNHPEGIKYDPDNNPEFTSDFTEPMYLYISLVPNNEYIIVNDTLGVTSPEGETDGPTEYYSVAGVGMGTNPDLLPSGIYIVHQGSKVYKQVVTH